jgi:hypothetical protein
MLCTIDTVCDEPGDEFLALRRVEGIEELSVPLEAAKEFDIVLRLVRRLSDPDVELVPKVHDPVLRRLQHRQHNMRVRILQRVHE